MVTEMLGEHVADSDEHVKGQVIMPFYILCDVSYSMLDDMDALNAGVARLCETIRQRSDLDDLARVSVIAFSDTAQVVTPLSQLTEVGTPTLTVQGGTNYGAAFEALAGAMRADRAALRAQEYKAYRPCAFFLSDGEPQDDDWQTRFQASLTKAGGNDAYAIFVPFGFRAARADVMSKLAYPPTMAKYYFARTNGISEVIDGIIQVIMKTVIAATVSAGAGAPELAMPMLEPNSPLTVHDSSIDEW